jgi:hypothetical protein
MKCRALVALVGLLIFGLSTNAQVFKFGVLAGLDVVDGISKTVPDIEFEEYYLGKNDPMISFNMNGFASYKSAGTLGFSVEPGFIKKGYTFKGYGQESRFEYNYIHMPLLADLYITDKLYFSIGPEIGIMINARIKSEDHTAEIDIVDKLELSGLLGVTYNISEKVGVGLRYNRGFTHIQTFHWFDEDGSILGETKDYNQYFQLQVRYKIFTCGKKGHS